MNRTSRLFFFAFLGHSLFAADIDSLLATAKAAKRQGDLANAQSAYESAFALALQHPEQRLTAIANEVATFYIGQKNETKAVEILTHAVDEEDNAKVPLIKEASLFISLENIYTRQRRYDDQVSILKRILQTWETSVGKDSPAAANVLYHLAAAEQLSGKLNDAEESIRRALAIFEKAYGEDSAPAGHAISLLSSIEKKLGNTDAATAATQRLTAIRQKEEGKPAENVGKSVTAPRVISQQDPSYSEKARKSRIQGTILLSVVVNESGQPERVKVLLPLGDGLDEEAIKAVNAWHFQPGMRDGAPVSVRATIEINFRLL